MYKKYSIFHFQFPISISHSPFPIPHSPFLIPHSSFPIPRFSNIPPVHACMVDSNFSVQLRSSNAATTKSGNKGQSVMVIGLSGVQFGL